MKKKDRAKGYSMIEWLKDILGDHYSEDIDQKVSAEIGKNFVARSDFNTLNEVKKGLDTQLKAANEQIDQFKSMDIDGIKKAADDWKQKAENAEKDAAEKIASIQFQTVLDHAIHTAKGRNATAIKALLDINTLKNSKNQSEDVRKALEAVKKENSYLFESDAMPPFAKGTQGPLDAQGGKDRANAAIRAMFGKE